MFCYCCDHIHPRTRAKAFAVWHNDRNGARLPLCKKCLDIWLDNADDAPELEPSNVVFL